MSVVVLGQALEVSHGWLPNYFALFLPRIACFLASANIYQGAYCYTLDLLALEQCVPSSSVSCPTPVKADCLAHTLSSYPDSHFSAFIHRGFSEEFHLGFDKSRIYLRSTKSNHPSCLALSSVAQVQISAKVSAGCFFLLTLFQLSTWA